MLHITEFDDNDFYDSIHSIRSGNERIGKYIAGKVGRIIKAS